MVYFSKLETLEKRGKEPLFDLLKNLQSWPMIDPNWNSSNFDWVELMAQLRLYNNDILISQWVGPDIMSSSNYIVQVSPLQPLPYLIFKDDILIFFFF